MSQLLVDWVMLTWVLSAPLSARFCLGWWELAEVAGQLDRMGEHPNQSQPNPGAKADGTPCSLFLQITSARGTLNEVCRQLPHFISSFRGRGRYPLKCTAIPASYSYAIRSHQQDGTPF